MFLVFNNRIVRKAIYMYIQNNGVIIFTYWCNNLGTSEVDISGYTCIWCVQTDGGYSIVFRFILWNITLCLELELKPSLFANSTSFERVLDVIWSYLMCFRFTYIRQIIFSLMKFSRSGRSRSLIHYDSESLGNGLSWIKNGIYQIWQI